LPNRAPLLNQAPPLPPPLPHLQARSRLPLTVRVVKLLVEHVRASTTLTVF
jgi:hypothetical protein